MTTTTGLSGGFATDLKAASAKLSSIQISARERCVLLSAYQDFIGYKKCFDASKYFDTSKYLSLSLLTKGTTIVGLFGMNSSQVHINGMMGEGQIVTSLFPTTRIPFPSHNAFDASLVINIPYLYLRIHG